MEEDVPCPQVRPGTLLIRTTASLLSAGTERMLVDFGRASLLNKARQQPDRVRQVLDKVVSDGLLPTLDAVRTKLDEPLPLGYSNVGRVLAVGAGVHGYRVGDRVVSNGRHAEVVCVAKNLCAPIPDAVSDKEAAFTMVSAIGLQGVRLVQPTLGESVAVFGLGLIGLITVQILRAHGARVVGFDPDPERVGIARSFGVDAVALGPEVDPVETAVAFARGSGVDAVLIAASTRSDELIHQAAQMCRQRGRIVLIGVVGLHLKRADFYEKELTFQVSCSYGPGRYDQNYEERGEDYPAGFVRWTENRNFEAVLDLMAQGRLRVQDLVTREVDFEDVRAAYDALTEGSELGILLRYAEPDREEELTRSVSVHRRAARAEEVTIGVIGAGSFARRQMLPALVRAKARVKWVASATGVTAAHTARRFDVERSTTDYRHILDDAEVDAVMIATRHHLHAPMVVEALEAGKSVFVEKPLCLSPEELDEIVAIYEQASSGDRGPILMVGFNRRFSPLAAGVRELIGQRRAPLAMTYTCNAGSLPVNHWLRDRAAGGGRLLGEACHFIDFAYFLTASPIVRMATLAQEGSEVARDTFAILASFEDGSLATINYFSTGSRRFPKEQITLFSEGRVLTIDNFRKVTGYGLRGRGIRRLWTQDRGHRGSFTAFVDALRNGAPSPIAFADLVHVTRATFAAERALEEGRMSIP